MKLNYINLIIKIILLKPKYPYSLHVPFFVIPSINAIILSIGSILVLFPFLFLSLYAALPTMLTTTTTSLSLLFLSPWF